MSTVVARDKLLSLIDFKILETIDSEIGEYLQRIGTLHIQIRHVVGLIEKRAGFPPGTLLISPVGELMLHHGKRVGSDLRIAQEFHGIPGGLYRVFQVSITHSCW